MTTKRFSVLAMLAFVGLSPALAYAQSDLCLEFASKICRGAELATCFDSEDSWQLLPDQCVSDIKKQIELDAEFTSGNGNSTVQSSSDDFIGSYSAFIGPEDLYNSAGKKLKQPWQVLRQDRANYHKFKVRQRGDENDPFFRDAGNREAMENKVRNGHIEKSAARTLMSGNAIVYVEIYGRNGIGTSVNVTVSR